MHTERLCMHHNVRDFLPDNESFWSREDELFWEHARRLDDGALEQSLSYVAMENGRMAGYVVFDRVSFTGNSDRRACILISALSVGPKFRNGVAARTLYARVNQWLYTNDADHTAYRYLLSYRNENPALDKYLSRHAGFEPFFVNPELFLALDLSTQG